MALNIEILGKALFVVGYEVHSQQNAGLLHVDVVAQRPPIFRLCAITFFSHVSTSNTGQPTPDLERTFFWRNSNQSAALLGHWKYLHDGTNEYLFDLQRERANFREHNPTMFHRLKNEFKT